MNSLFIFRRDLRIQDNTAFNAAISNSESITSVFILDPRQVHSHEYRSQPGLHFMFESLIELNAELQKKGGKLYLFYGEAELVIQNLLDSNNFKAVYFNRDYTPFSRMRDEKIYNLCKDKKIELKTFHDALLTSPKDGLKEDKTPYTVFTPFFKKNSQKIPEKRKTVDSSSKFSNLILDYEKDFSFLLELSQNIPKLEKVALKGGRVEGLKLLNNIKNIQNYNSERDIPSLIGTSRLSAHHKFGTVSIRESYWTAKENLQPDNRFITELYWRDFMTQIGFFFPHVFEGAFKKQYNNIEWENDLEKFNAWCAGRTGYPIVDAGMRELNETGLMHNRTRMITASFLVKDLHIDWRWGEKYFAKKLIDYDPAVNNGSWQWAASTGCDAQPYFIIFNPWLQQIKFDPECIYIKKWIPELIDFPNKIINDGEKTGFVAGYIKPVVEHSHAKKIAVELFSSCGR